MVRLNAEAMSKAVSSMIAVLRGGRVSIVLADAMHVECQTRAVRSLNSDERVRSVFGILSGVIQAPACAKGLPSWQ